MSCPDCTKGDFLPGEPKGSINSEYQGAYFTSESGGEPSKRAVILLTDAFGLPLKNCKIIADEIATKLECDVWIPDYFNGKSIPIPHYKLTSYLTIIAFRKTTGSSFGDGDARQSWCKDDRLGLDKVYS